MAQRDGRSPQTSNVWLKKVKAVYSASRETHLRATGRHLPYGITRHK